MSHLSRILLIAGAAAAVAAPAGAAGFYVQEQSVEGLGRAYSGEAADLGAQSLWWNPAAIAGIDDSQAYVGLQVVDIGAKASDAGSAIVRPGQAPAPVGGVPVQNNPLQVGYVPNLAAAWRISSQWSLGLAVTAPFDFTTKYAPDNWARYGALTSRLTDIDVQPTLAWRPSPLIGIGVGIDAQYADADLTNALPNLSPLLPDGSSSLRGSGWDYGWVAGLQLHPTGDLTLAASYRSQIDHRLSGQVATAGLLGPLAANNFTLPATAKYTTPDIATVSARWRLGGPWTVEAEVQHFGWSRFNAITVAYAGQSTPIPENYKDTTSVAVGADYAVSPKLILRGGVQFDPTPTPDNGRDPRVPDADRTLFSLGASWAATHGLTLDGAVAYVDFAHSRINNLTAAYYGTPAQTPIDQVGNVAGGGVIASVGARFGF